MSRFPNRRWLVIPATEVENINFDEVLESSAETLRYSVDGTQTFVKYDVSILEESYTHTTTDLESGEEVTQTVEAGIYGRPSIYSEDYTEYNHDEILQLLASEDWTTPIEME